MGDLKFIDINDFELYSGKQISIQLSYQVFGQPLHDAPIVLVNHALTGNSDVCGENGWWKTLIGKDKVIDTNHYTIISFNIPGNGYGNEVSDVFENYKSFIARDIAKIFYTGLDALNINRLYACIGGSVGGGIAWEMAAIRPDFIDYVIPVACDWKSTDWLIANCYIQDQILNHSSEPLKDARIHAMTFYRTPESFTEKFNRTKNDNTLYNVESWLEHHGKKIDERFKLSAYKMMNQILKTIDITRNGKTFIETVESITSHIHIITINSDLFFKPEESWNTYIDLKLVKENVTIGEIKSIHGHDAFLIEYQQLNRLLKPIF